MSFIEDREIERVYLEDSLLHALYKGETLIWERPDDLSAQDEITFRNLPGIPAERPSGNLGESNLPWVNKVVFARGKIFALHHNAIFDEKGFSRPYLNIYISEFDLFGSRIRTSTIGSFGVGGEAPVLDFIRYRRIRSINRLQTDHGENPIESFAFDGDYFYINLEFDPTREELSSQSQFQHYPSTLMVDYNTLKIVGSHSYQAVGRPSEDAYILGGLNERPDSLPFYGWSDDWRYWGLRKFTSLIESLSNISSGRGVPTANRSYQLAEPRQSIIENIGVINGYPSVEPRESVYQLININAAEKAGHSLIVMYKFPEEGDPDYFNKGIRTGSFNPTILRGPGYARTDGRFEWWEWGPDANGQYPYVLRNRPSDPPLPTVKGKLDAQFWTAAWSRFVKIDNSFKLQYILSVGNSLYVIAQKWPVSNLAPTTPLELKLYRFEEDWANLTRENIFTYDKDNLPIESQRYLGNWYGPTPSAKIVDKFVLQPKESYDIDIDNSKLTAEFEVDDISNPGMKRTAKLSFYPRWWFTDGKTLFALSPALEPLYPDPDSNNFVPPTRTFAFSLADGTFIGDA